jgi:hypothetical protein
MLGKFMIRQTGNSTTRNTQIRGSHGCHSGFCLDPLLEQGKSHLLADLRLHGIQKQIAIPTNTSDKYIAKN